MAGKYIDSTVVNMGKVKAGTTIRPKFEFKNCNILSVTPDCGCTDSTTVNNVVTLGYIVPSPSMQHKQQKTTQQFSKGATVLIEDEITKEQQTAYITFIVTSQ